jgi:serpin B
MKQTGTLAYRDDGEAQLVELPMYGGYEALLVAVPHAGVSLAQYEADLQTSGLPSPVTTAALVSLQLPKIDLSGASFSLNAVLKQLGMVAPFDQTTADFSGMATGSGPDGGNPGLYIEDVVQETSLTFDESGLEGAAATAVIIDGDAAIAVPVEASAPAPIPVDANRPYLVEVVDTQTGAVLLLGHVEDPTAP